MKYILSLAVILLVVGCHKSTENTKKENVNDEDEHRSTKVM